MSRTKAIPVRKGGPVWDERRNTSRVFPVPPTALPEALSALAAFRRSSPEHVAWIEEGAPRPTDDEHRRRFGEPYSPSSSGRRGRSR